MSPSPRPSSRVLWSLFLGAPITGMTYFMVVYLAAEAACARGTPGFSSWALGVVIVVATVTAVGALLTAVVWAARLRSSAESADTADFVGGTALMLVGLFGLFVFVVAAPAVGASLC